MCVPLHFFRPRQPIRPWSLVLLPSLAREAPSCSPSSSRRLPPFVPVCLAALGWGTRPGLEAKRPRAGLSKTGSYKRGDHPPLRFRLGHSVVTESLQESIGASPRDWLWPACSRGRQLERRPAALRRAEGGLKALRGGSDRVPGGRSKRDAQSGPPRRGGPRSASALTFKEQQALTCLKNKGTGLANTCPAIEAGSSATKLPSTAHELTKFCLLPSPSLQQKALDRDSGSGHLPELLGQKPSAAPRPALAGRGPPAAPAAMGSCASRDRADGADGAAADAGDGDAGSEAGRCVPPPPPPSPAPGRPQRKMRPRTGGRRCCCGPAPSLQPGPGPQQGWPPRQAAPPGPPAAKGTRLAPASSLPAPGRCGSGPGTGAAGGAASGPLPWHARPPNRPARAGADARRTGRPAGRRGSCGE